MPPPNLLYIFIKLSPADKGQTPREESHFGDRFRAARYLIKTGKRFVNAFDRWMPVRTYAIKPIFSLLHYALEAMPCSHEDRCRRPEHSWFIGPKTGSGHRGAFIASPPEAGAWPNSPEEAGRASRCGRFSLAAIRRASMRQAPINGSFPVLTSPIFKTIIWMATGGDHDCR